MNLARRSHDALTPSNELSPPSRPKKPFCKIYRVISTRMCPFNHKCAPALSITYNAEISAPRSDIFAIARMSALRRSTTGNLTGL
jgi:hypothetical protein